MSLINPVTHIKSGELEWIGKILTNNEGGLTAHFSILIAAMDGLN